MNEIDDNHHSQGENFQFSDQHDQEMDELSLSAAQCFDLLESINEAFYGLDSDWRFIYLNRKAEQLWGRKRETLIGKHIWTEFPQGVNTQAYQEMHRALEEQKTIRFETFSSVLDTWVEVEVYPTGTGLSVYFHNITQRKQAEAALKNSQEQLRLITDALPVLISFVDPQMRYQFVNKGYEELFGLERNQIIGRPVTEIIGRDEFETAKSSLEAALSGEIIQYEHEMPYTVGARFTRTQMLPFRRDDGTVAGVIAMVDDITERKRSEEGLAQLASIVTSSNDSIITESLDGIITSWNQGAARIFGYSADEAIGHPVTIIIPPERIAEEAAFLQKIASGESVENYDTIRLKKDSSEVFVSVSLSPIKDAHGNIVGASKISQDITERKQADAGLVRLAAIITSSSDAIFTTTLDGFVTSWNRGAEKIFGYSADEIIQKPFTIVIPAEKMSEESIRLHKIANGEDVEHYDSVRLNKDGREVFVSVSLSPLKDGRGNIVGVSRITQDITERKLKEAQLRESEAALKQAQRVAHVGSWTWQVQPNRLEWSDEMYHIFGIDKESFSGDLSEVISRAIHPDDRAAVERANVSVIKDGTPAPLEYRVVWADGTVRVVWAEAGDMILDSAGKPAILTGIVQDITERKRAAEAIRESEELFRTTFEQAAVGIAHVSPDGRFLRINRTFCDMVGYDCAELLTKTFIDVTHPEDLNADLELVQSVLNREIESYTLDKRYIRKDQTIVWVQLTVAITWNPDDTPKYFISIVQDITERKRAEAALQGYAERMAAINRLDRIISANLEIGLVYDNFVKELHALMPLDRTSIVRLNESGEEWQVARQWTQHQPIILPGEWRQVQGSVIEWLVNHKTPFSEAEVGERGKWPETALLQREGIRSRLLLPLIIQERVAGVLTVASRQPSAFSEEDQSILMTFADQLAIAVQNATLFEQVKHHAAELEQRVTERTAQLEASNKELEAFSYSVSHDLRSPLRAIDGFSRILARDYTGLLPDAAERYLKLIRDNTQQMGTLIDDLLTFSRLNRQPLNKQPIALARMVQQVYGELTTEEDTRQVEIVIGDLPDCQADPTLFKQVIVNVMSNALKFTAQRAVARIEVTSVEVDGERVYSVRDNGAGFDMAYADKLFGVFQRLHRADEFPGTGVGLAIVQRIIHRHGGRIWAEAEVDKGATFYFTLEGGQSHV